MIVTGNPELMTAAEKGDAECVKLFITAGADVNAQDTHGNTVLQQASEAPPQTDEA